jgi:hypothetical protein
MCEENIFDPAHSFEGRDESTHIPRRVNQPIAVRMPEKIAVRPEGFLGIETIVIEILIYIEREASESLSHLVLVCLKRAY